MHVFQDQACSKPIKYGVGAYLFDAAYGKPLIISVHRDPKAKIHFRSQGGLSDQKNAQGI